MGPARYGHLEPFLMKVMGDLPTALEGTPARTDSHCFVIFHGEVSEDSDGPVEVCLPFAGELEAPAGMNIRVEPAHQEAFTTITTEQCIYPTILEAYDGPRIHQEGRHGANRFAARGLFRGAHEGWSERSLLRCGLARRAGTAGRLGRSGTLGVAPIGRAEEVDDQGPDGGRSRGPPQSEHHYPAAQTAISVPVFRT